MSKKHLRRRPQHVGKDETWWYYEENGGITVVVSGHVVRIPWTRIRAALKRKDAKP